MRTELNGQIANTPANILVCCAKRRVWRLREFRSSLILPSLLLIFLLAFLPAATGCTKPQSNFAEQLRAANASSRWLADRNFLEEQIKDASYLDDLLARLNDALLRLPQVKTSQPFDWTALVSRDPLPNAHSLGGGVIILSAGMLRLVATEAELAAVLSHEMAHQVLGHSATALKRVEKRLPGERNAPPETHFSVQQELAGR